MMRRILITGALLLIASSTFGQFLPGRGQVRQGNRAYEREDYAGAEARYMGALSRDPASPEGHFNLGDAYYRQGRFEEAEQRFSTLSQTPAPPEQWSQTFYNQGNAQVQQYKTNWNREKLQQALESYKQSLRLNPGDQQAKFNLAYVQKLLEGDGGGGGGENDQDQNNDQNDQNNNQDQNPDQNDQNNDKNQDPNEDQGDQNGGQQPPAEGRMSREEAEQMLNAMQASEDRTREKVDEQQGAVVGRSGKNW